MTHSSLPVENKRALDPNVAQQHAADPTSCVWVGASAGTGKTKVLVDRLLRLFLPQPNGREGTPPHRILCLTFTKAGASEMLLRINEVLAQWAIAEEESLRKSLQKLTGTPPSNEEVQAARRLFAEVTDAPGGLKIMTIHAFCQSVLGRFPLEAHLPPAFKVTEETGARALMNKARDDILREALAQPDSVHGQALKKIATHQNAEQFISLLGNLNSERTQQAIAATPHFKNDLYRLFNLTPGDNESSILNAACQSTAFDETALRSACAILAEGTEKTDQPKGIAIAQWLDFSVEKRAQNFTNYTKTFLKADGEIYKKLMTAGLHKKAPDAALTLQNEAVRLKDVQDKCRATRTIELTNALFQIGQKIINRYQDLKEKSGVLDYDDLIMKTLALLKQEGIAPWVLFKLDGGLDHILIDEAQDTNPEQWQIIAALCDDFFSGQGTNEERVRTIFTVGDEKQSIYSFQRAAPQEFERMRTHFAQRVQDAGQKWRDETLNISFRSTKSVLQLVDEVFSDPAVGQGLGQSIPEHHSFRTGQAGLCELWPLFTPAEEEAFPTWMPPIKPLKNTSPATALANHIGDTILAWLDRKEPLESTGRPIRPGDIMILVRTRNAFVGQMVRALKTREIPVSGIDRMVLSDQLAVMDLCAAAQFALLPDDDLTLACLLKSPFIGWDEERLFNLAYDRKMSLWETLKQSESSGFINWLESLLHSACTDHPYEFFSRLLHHPCPASAKSGWHAIRQRLGEDAIDPLNEFLNTALQFEKEHIPALQNFLIHQQKENTTIKRELEEAGSHVRIMTVHGSKGLQAPIVFLPDTTRTATSKRTDRILWPDKSGQPVPLWAARSEDEPSLYKEARAQVTSLLDEEYRRLLYVAMTRAEDRLYIGGYHGKQKPLDDCWYNHIAAAFERLQNAEHFSFPGDEEKEGWRLYNPQTHTKNHDGLLSETQDKDNTPLPDLPWMHTPAPEEPNPPRPLIPSRPSDMEPAAHSPQNCDDSHRFLRGNITHKLLQILPDIPTAQREKAAQNYIRKAGAILNPAIQKDILSETLAVLNHPEFSPLFGANSRAEVPVTGLVGGQLISAQIDRLLITDKEIWIVDYKTNRPPPQDEKNIPSIYRKQIASYCDIVSKIYNGRTVRGFLLWTDGVRLVELTL